MVALWWSRGNWLVTPVCSKPWLQRTGCPRVGWRDVMKAPGGTFLRVRTLRASWMHYQGCASALLLESWCFAKEFQLEMTEPQINLNLCIAIKTNIWSQRVKVMPLSLMTCVQPLTPCGRRKESIPSGCPLQTHYGVYMTPILPSKN